jgi:hypothetical protein
LDNSDPDAFEDDDRQDAETVAALKYGAFSV